MDLERLRAEWVAARERHREAKREEQRSRKEVERWFHRTRDEMRRRVNSVEFVQAFPETKIAFDANCFDSKAGSVKPWWDVLEKSVRAGGHRDVVYKLGKFFGVKFKPYGAIKAAAKVAKVGAVLAAVGVVLDIHDWVKSAKSAKKREAARKDAAKFLHDSRDEIRATLLSVERGPCAYLERYIAELQRVRVEIHTEATEAQKTQQALNEQLVEINAMISDARHRLALPANAEDDDE